MTEPPPRWTILVATLGRRQQSLSHLFDGLMPQVDQMAGQVTVEALWNNGERSPGLVRQDLLDHSAAEYVCFVDDDDVVASNYVEAIYPLLDGVDYVGFKVDVVPLGHADTHVTATHSLKYGKWYEDETGLYRDTSHLNPVRRELATRVRFGDEYFREDYHWAQELRDHVRTENYLDEVMYFYSPAGEIHEHGYPPPDVGSRARLTVPSPNFHWNPASSQEG